MGVIAAVIARFIPAIIRALYYTALASPALLIISTLLSPETRQQAQQFTNILVAAVSLTITFSVVYLTISIVRDLSSAIKTSLREASE